MTPARLPKPVCRRAVQSGETFWLAFLFRPPVVLFPNPAQPVEVLFAKRVFSIEGKVSAIPTVWEIVPKPSVTNVASRVQLLFYQIFSWLVMFVQQDVFQFKDASLVLNSNI
jgi:hypothetical protein